MGLYQNFCVSKEKINTMKVLHRMGKLLRSWKALENLVEMSNLAITMEKNLEVP
jgi:hypothetical protein